MRATERLVKQTTEARSARRNVTTKPQAVDANIRAAENRLRRKFGTQVRIVQSAGGQTGRIELEFYNQGDLDRLYSLLTTDAA